MNRAEGTCCHILGGRNAEFPVTGIRMKSGDDKNFTFQTFLSQNVRVLGLVGETGSLYSCFAQTPAKRP